MITYVEVARSARNKWFVVGEEITEDFEAFLSKNPRRVAEGIYEIEVHFADEVSGELHYEGMYVKIINKE